MYISLSVAADMPVSADSSVFFLICLFISFLSLTFTVAIYL